MHILLFNCGPEELSFFSQLVSNRANHPDAEKSTLGSWWVSQRWSVRWVHRRGSLADELYPNENSGERSYIGKVKAWGFPDNLVIQNHFSCGKNQKNPENLAAISS